MESTWRSKLEIHIILSSLPLAASFGNYGNGELYDSSDSLFSNSEAPFSVELSLVDLQLLALISSVISGFGSLKGAWCSSLRYSDRIIL